MAAVAGRAELVRKVIRPALHSGDIVLCDRFFDSTIAYQGYGRGMAVATARAVICVAIEDTQPDVTFFLRVSQEVSDARKGVRIEKAVATAEQDRFDSETHAFFSRVQAGYEKIAAQNPERIQVIDANRSMDEIQAEIRRVAVQALSQRAQKS
jgi:dTMP kinase